MEKTNKYYNVIETLVKQNKKYQGLEAILDDIIDDVYSHSEVIINSINNDGVIQSYLEKVVSTSIITVPKKMGFHPEIKHRTIDAQQILENAAQRRAEKVNTELVDKMINNIAPEREEVPSETPETTSELTELEPEESVLTLENAPSDIEQETDDNFLNINEKQEELTDNQDNELDEIITSETLETEDLEESEPVVETAEDNSVLDTDLEISDLDNEDANIVEDNQNDSLELNDLEEVSLTDTTEAGNDDIQEFEELETEELEPTDDTELLTDVQAESMADDNLEIPEPTEELQESELDDLTDTDNDFETLEPAETLDLDLQEDDNQDSLTEVDSLEESPLDVINDNGLEQIADVITETLENPGNTSSENTDFKPTDYSVFSYSTDKYNDDIDAEEIVNEIKDLASKHPELNIINVYNLKFKDKLTIPQVASELNMSEDNVIEALNELVAIVQ